MKNNAKITGKVKESHGDLMTIADFRECVSDGWFTDYDGFGHYSDGENEFDEIVNPGYIKSKYSHVIWYNK